jgi:hypothetical protein
MGQEFICSSVGALPFTFMLYLYAFDDVGAGLLFFVFDSYLVCISTLDKEYRDMSSSRINRDLTIMVHLILWLMV